MSFSSLPRHVPIFGWTACLWLLGCATSPPPATPGGPANATVPPATASAAVPSPSVTGAPAPPASPAEVLERGRAGLDSCYARARSANPNLGRTSIEITFTIDPDGTTRLVDLKYRNKMDDASKECMRNAALGLRFPESMTGKQTATIVFTPPGSAP